MKLAIKQALDIIICSVLIIFIEVLCEYYLPYNSKINTDVNIILTMALFAGYEISLTKDKIKITLIRYLIFSVLGIYMVSKNNTYNVSLIKISIFSLSVSARMYFSLLDGIMGNMAKNKTLHIARANIDNAIHKN